MKDIIIKQASVVGLHLQVVQDFFQYFGLAGEVLYRPPSGSDIVLQSPGLEEKLVLSEFRNVEITDHTSKEKFVIYHNDPVELLRKMVAYLQEKQFKVKQAINGQVCILTCDLFPLMYFEIREPVLRSR